MRGELKGVKDYREINKKTRKYMEMAKETRIEGQSKKWKHASDSIIARKLTNKSYTVPQRNWVNLQPYTTSKESTSLRSLKYLTDGQSTAQTYTIMRLMGIQRLLIAHRYQMKSLFLSYEKRWKQQIKH